MKRIADSTVRRLSAYLRFLEDFETRGLSTISSDELAKRGGTTSAQVRKDLSFFGSFGKRGLGYSVPELAGQLRDIDQLEKDIAREKADIVVLTVPGDQAQALLDRVVKAGIKAVLNFAPTQLQSPADVTVKTVNMAMELEGLSFALTNRD